MALPRWWRYFFQRAGVCILRYLRFFLWALLLLLLLHREVVYDEPFGVFNNNIMTLHDQPEE